MSDRGKAFYRMLRHKYGHWHVLLTWTIQKRDHTTRVLASGQAHFWRKLREMQDARDAKAVDNT